MSENFSQRFKNAIRANTPYVGTIAAALIFLSWVVTNSLQRYAENMANIAGSTIQRQNAALRHDQLVMYFNNMQKDRVRSEAKALFDDEKKSAFERTLSELSWVDVWSSDMFQLNQLADELESEIQAANLSRSDSENALKRVEMVRQVTKKFWDTTTEFRSKFDQMAPGGVSISNPPANANEIERQVLAHRDQSEQILKEAEPLTNELLSELGWIKHVQSIRAKRAELVANIAQVIAMLVFISGTLLAIYAKWIDEKKKNNV